MKYIILAIVIACIVAAVYVADYFIERHVRKKRAEFKKSVDERCNNIMANAEKIKAIINEKKAECNNLPEEYREQFLSKYDELEKNIDKNREDAARIRESLESES